MADQIGALYDNGQPAYWIDPAGKPYKYLQVNGTTTQQKVYLSPQAMGDYSGHGPNAMPSGGGSFFHGAPQWDTTTGTWHKPFNWSSLMALGTAGAIAAPFAAGALAGSGAGSAAGGAGATTFGTGATGSMIGAEGAGWAGAGAAGGGAGTVGSILAGHAVPQGISAISNYFGNRSANNAAERAANTQAAASKYAADLEAKAAEEALAWLKEQHQQRETQLTPYRQLGANSLRQLSTPIPGVGTIMNGGR